MSISIIIPLCNGESTILQTIKSLLDQDSAFDEVIIINDGSSDKSEAIVLEYIKRKKIKKCRLITHKKSIGLAATYNEGIKLADSELVVILHQDVVLFKNSLKTLTQPFETNDSNIVASYHRVLHPIEIWQKYNFWQKAFFSRLVGKDYYGMDGKFDCFRKKDLAKIGFFDSKTFRTAGEDGDLIHRLQAIGQLVKTEAKIIHLHKNDHSFGLRNIVYKQAQYSEAQGALLRKGVIRTPKQFARSFFREILLITLLIPYIQYLSLILILLYSFLYTGKVFKVEYKNYRILVLPFLNIFLLLVSFYYSLRGFISGKQRF